ncbi:MAG: glycosyltransferase family protein [Thermodesulfobacteriota bacterium]
MKARPLAVYVSPCLSPWLDRLDMDVAVLRPEPGIFDLRASLDEQGIEPDVIIQDEILAPRVLLKGLESYACPKIFWSLDPHLNHYWQAPYRNLFDVAACTQKNWLGRVRASMPGRVEWLTWSALPMPWRPHGGRRDALAFVGRVTEFRPMRQRFAAFLSDNFPMRLETDIPPPDVQPAYAMARLAPNESIGGEITQRLFIAAGAGCLVLEPSHPNGLEELFEPGREVETYADALELAERVAHHLKHPGEAERKGRAALKRLTRDHQPANRMAAMGRLARDAWSASARGPEADRLFWLAAGRCLESSLLAARPEVVVRGLAAHRDDPECHAGLISLLTAGGEGRKALELGARRLASGFAPDHAGFNACVCSLALRLGEYGLALTLYEAFAEAAGEPAPRAGTPAALYAALGETLARRGAVWRPGFPFDGARHLPATAVEMYNMCLFLEPDNQPVLKRAEALLRDYPGTELTRLGYLSELSLRNRDDFRLGLALGVLDLQTFRPEEGLEEIRMARDAAAAQGRLASFGRLLTARDPRGLVRAAL